MRQFRSLLKQAKKTAQSWSNEDQFDRFNELDSTVGQIYQRTNAEQWAVNPNIHFNKWPDFVRKDFIPVRDAFQDLFGLFICQECGSILQLAKRDMKAISVQCNCGKTNWNLVEKGSA